MRFTLTSEAGLNDGLAFPFVYAAILLATEGARRATGRSSGSAGTSSARSLLGVARRASPSAGCWPAVAFRVAAAGRCGVAERGESLLALAALRRRRTASARSAGGYGFLSVFACAMTLPLGRARATTTTPRMHEVAERLERLLTLFVLLVLGIALTRGLLDDPRLARRRDRPGAASSSIRPLAGLRSPSGPVAGEDGGLTAAERWAAIAFFGVRGVGLDLLPRVRRRGGRATSARTGCGRRSPSPSCCR